MAKLGKMWVVWEVGQDGQERRIGAFGRDRMIEEVGRIGETAIVGKRRKDGLLRVVSPQTIRRLLSTPPERALFLGVHPRGWESIGG